MSVKSSKNFSEGEIEEPFFDDLETWKKDYLEVNPPFVSEEEKLEEINRKQEAFDNEMKKKDKNAFEMVDKNGDKLLSKDVINLLNISRSSTAT
jgi:predicted transcriptional regulator